MSLLQSPTTILGMVNYAWGQAPKPPNMVVSYIKLSGIHINKREQGSKQELETEKCLQIVVGDCNTE